MAVATRSTTMWKPSEPSSGEKVPLTVFDSAAANTFVAVVFAFHAPAPTNHEMIEGLLRTVSRFPHLAGRLAVDDRSRPCIHLNNAGVVVIEAAASADLADALADDMAASVNELYPTVEKGGVDVALFHVQLTRYTCGGMVVGIACHHHVADGHAMNTFFAAWAGEVRGASAMSGSDSPLPFLDRAATAVPRFPPAPSFDHRAVEFETKNGTNRKSYTILPMDKIKNLTVHFPTEFVTDLKARVGGRCSTFQCLLAHVWKRITEARGLKQEEFTQVRAAVNCRARAKPPLPMDFFGNMVLWAFPRLQVRDLLSSSYTRVVGTIRDAVARVDGEYIHSFVDFGAVADARGEELVATAAKPGTMFCPDLEVDSWLGFGFHDLDFGGGPPCAFLPPDLPVDGLMIFVPSCAAKGGVDLFMAMAEDHVEVFKQICYCLN